jgi:hypothetical protein
MQTRSRNITTALVEITKVFKTKKEGPGAIRKTTKRTIVTTKAKVEADPQENSHPLDVPSLRHAELIVRKNND